MRCHQAEVSALRQQVAETARKSEKEAGEAAALRLRVEALQQQVAAEESKSKHAVAEAEQKGKKEVEALQRQVADADSKVNQVDYAY
jgi:predicted  nucleic acid-binding Zn-ribbon protein